MQHFHPASLHNFYVPVQLIVFRIIFLFSTASELNEHYAFKNVIRYRIFYKDVVENYNLARLIILRYRNRIESN